MLARLRLAPADIAILAVGVLFGAISFFYPYGRDQALFHYVGSQWFGGHGQIPYRDLIEHKPPGIFVVYGVFSRIFGDAQWPVRVLDMALLAVTAITSALLVTKRDQTLATRHATLAVTVSAIIYYGTFNFWDTAQCDFVYVTLSVVALLWIQRGENRARAAVGAGVLFGAALLVKPLAGAFGLLALVLAVLRARAESPGWRGSLVAAVQLGLGTAILPVLMCVYFAANGALDDFGLWVGKVNAYYAKHESPIKSVDDFLAHLRFPIIFFSSFGFALLAVFFGRIVRAREDADAKYETRMGIALFVAGLLGVVAQGKFFRYHFAALLPFYFGAVVIAIRWVAGNVQRRLEVTVLGAAAALFLLQEPAASGDSWLRAVATGFDRLRGRATQEQWERVFVAPTLYYDYADAAAAGRWLAAHTTPNDPVVVRGFEPVLYIVSHRRYTGRFFWSSFITDARRSMRHDEWLNEEASHFDKTRPPYAVAINDHEPIDGVDWFAARGYTEVVRFGIYRIMERH